ncbi:hypothetical protein FI667_g15546, partial [Globisporangium splendens]
MKPAKKQQTRRIPSAAVALGVLVVLGVFSLLARVRVVRLTARSDASVMTAQQQQQLAELCYKQRDLGLLEEIRASKRQFCGYDSLSGQKGQDPAASTEVNVYNVAGGVKVTVFRNLELNLVKVDITQPISDISQDGGDHDPRFVFTDQIVCCQCQQFAKSKHGSRFSPNAWAIWEAILTGVDTRADPKSTVCDPAHARLQPGPAHGDRLVEFTQPVILIARRDDHNPFFQVSSTLNAWFVAKALGWDLQQTQVVYLDAGYPSPVDALRQKLLAPNHDIVTGQSLMGKRVHFQGNVMLPPEEGSGPMMQHLNDVEPCHASQLFKQFREVALTTMGVSSSKPAPLEGEAVVVTVITRRPYKGRTVQRVWVNEDEVLDKMRDEYKHLNVVFQSVDFVDLTIAQQMNVTANSDIVIGMHGAGMVNVLWTRPETLVVEIFPKRRRRWGYRNLCQFVGCDWHEFRGGTDIGYFWTRANAKDKEISYDEWRAFFDPLFQARYRAIKSR